MKVYRGEVKNSVPRVTVDSKSLPTKAIKGDPRTVDFEWGKDGGGAQRLSLSILSDAIDDQSAIFHHQHFSQSVIAKLDSTWEFTSDDVKEWCDYENAIGYAAQQGVWSPDSKNAPIQLPSLTSKLARDPNYRLQKSNAAPSV